MTKNTDVTLNPLQAVLTETALSDAVRKDLRQWYREHQGLTPKDTSGRDYLAMFADAVTAEMDTINAIRAAQGFNPWPITTVCKGMDDELHAWAQR